MGKGLKLTIVSLCLFGLGFLLSDCMLVKDWGTDSQARRLAWSTNSFFEEVLRLIILGQWAVYPIPGFSTTTTLHNPYNAKDKTKATFVAYNGWLEDVYLNTSGTKEAGNLRRFIVTTAEKHVHEKDTTHGTLKDGSHHHEIIICDSCLAIQAKGFHYAYEVSLEKPSLVSWGTLEQNDPIGFPLSFQMTIMTGTNRTTGRKECQVNLEEIKVGYDPDHWINDSINHEGQADSGTFSFISDEIQDWILDHFNSTIIEKIQSSVNGFAQLLITKKNMCTDFLTPGIFIHVDKQHCS